MQKLSRLMALQRFKGQFVSSAEPAESAFGFHSPSDARGVHKGLGQCGLSGENKIQWQLAEALAHQLIWEDVMTS